MTRSRPISFLTGAALVALVALAVAGCGGGDNGDANASTTSPKTAGGRAATVGVAASRLGKILVDSQGRTLYLFEKDTGTESTCSGACASAWPPLRANGKPTAGPGVTASLLATSTRSDGNPQVTYNGHPLYLYQGDSKAGDTNGQDITAFGAAWYALTPAGDQISNASSSSGGANGY